MAEAAATLGLVSTIIVIVDLATKLSSRLHDFYKSIGDAPKAFRDISIQLPLAQLVERVLPSPTDSLFQRTQKAVVSVQNEKEIEQMKKDIEAYKFTLTVYFSHRSCNTRANHNGIFEDQCFNVPSLKVAQFVMRKSLLEQLEASILRPQNSLNIP